MAPVMKSDAVDERKMSMPIKSSASPDLAYRNAFQIHGLQAV